MPLNIACLFFFTQEACKSFLFSFFFQVTHLGKRSCVSGTIGAVDIHPGSRPHAHRHSAEGDLPEFTGDGLLPSWCPQVMSEVNKPLYTLRAIGVTLCLAWRIGVWLPSQGAWGQVSPFSGTSTRPPKQNSLFVFMYMTFTTKDTSFVTLETGPLSLRSVLCKVRYHAPS